MKKIRHWFISGLLALVPIVVTIYIVVFFMKVFDNFLGRYVTLILRRPIPGVGFITGIIFIFLAGFVVTNVIGQRLIRLGERILMKVPVIPKIYFGAKQVVEAFTANNGTKAFEKVVLVEYPRAGTYAVGFISGVTEGEIQEKTSKKMINVFIPTTPNPTSGVLILVPEDEVIHLKMTIEDGFKFIVSGGVVVPDSYKSSDNGNKKSNRG